MGSTESEIIREIKEFMDQKGGGYSSWSVAVSSLDNIEVVFEKEGSKEERPSSWICRTATRPDVARVIGLYCVNILGTRGDVERSPEDASTILVFKRGSPSGR